MVIALLPSVLIQWRSPAHWMLWMAWTGLAITITGFAPGFCRNVWTLVREFRQHRRGLIAQFDHDIGEFQGLASRLAVYPKRELEALARGARMAHERLGSRLTTLLGGIERLGVLPLLLALFSVLRNWRDLLALPGWLAVLGVMSAIVWLICWSGAEFRRRVQFYGYLLDEALIVQREREGMVISSPEEKKSEYGGAEVITSLRKNGVCVHLWLQCARLLGKADSPSLSVAGRAMPF